MPIECPARLTSEFFVPDRTSIKRRVQATAKRAFDFIVALFLLVLLSPVFIVVAVLIKLNSPGRVFFSQYRYGCGGEPFRLYKFRSMYAHLCNKTGGDQAQQNDVRVTSLGKILRRLSIDELPQLYNVLRGEMALVGPRPHAVEHDLHYSQHIPNYLKRLSVKPGITGWAQVNGFRGETWIMEQMHYRVLYDLDYIQQQSLRMDVFILGRTGKLLFNSRAY